jgi:hypothetical protein
MSKPHETRNSEQIQREIERARAEMGETLSKGVGRASLRVT